MAVFYRSVEKMKKDKPIFLVRRLFSHFRNHGQFYQWYHFNRNLMVSNNIIIDFL